MLIVILSTIAAVWLGVLIVRLVWYRRSVSACARCGYELAGIGPRGCPECGLEVGAKWKGRRRRVLARFVIGWPGLVVYCALAVSAAWFFRDDWEGRLPDSVLVRIAPVDRPKDEQSASFRLFRALHNRSTSPWTRASAGDLAVMYERQVDAAIEAETLMMVRSEKPPFRTIEVAVPEAYASFNRVVCVIRHPNGHVLMERSPWEEDRGQFPVWTNDYNPRRVFTVAESVEYVEMEIKPAPGQVPEGPAYYFRRRVYLPGVPRP